MSFKFDPDAVNELHEGIASFKIIDATDTDQYGKQLRTRDGQHSMIKLTLRVVDDTNSSGLINDNLVSNAPWKVRQLLKAVNRVSWYNTGSLSPSQLINLQGQCMLKNREYQGKKYMNIASYIEIEQSESVNPPGNLSIDDLDGIPF